MACVQYDLLTGRTHTATPCSKYFVLPSQRHSENLQKSSASHKKPYVYLFQNSWMASEAKIHTLLQIWTETRPFVEAQNQLSCTTSHLHCLLRVWKYSWYCIADYKQTCLFSCFRANRRAMAGSEWPEGSLLFWVERWDSCDIHQMAAQTSHLHEWSRGLCCYEGAGITMQSLCRNAS